MNKDFIKYIESLRLTGEKKISLKKDFDTNYTHKLFTKEEGQAILEEGKSNLSRLQDKLYAHNKHSVLILFQAMDTAGKDGAIKHVMSGLNPQGVRVTSFKVPSREELAHDYFWRYNRELPACGQIGIFNRSYYENVLVTRVHPEFILGENIPSVKSIKDVNKKFWQHRFKQMNRFEKNLTENGTLILKFFLYLSKDEQKKRLIERIDHPGKNWKFSLPDIEERKFWKEYMHVYEDMLNNTSTEYAPWYVLPADDKWFTRLCLGTIIYKAFEELKLNYPKVNKEEKAKLEEVKLQLLGEK